MGKSTISMTIFNSYVSLPEGNWGFNHQKKTAALSWGFLESKNHTSAGFSSRDSGRHDWSL
jgi:hypothetical protein